MDHPLAGNHTARGERLDSWKEIAAYLKRDPGTERQALVAEAAQLRRCLSAGHLHAGDGWNPLAYLQKVEAKLRAPREHY